LSNTNFLELGAGSGLISIYFARKKANVTAIDINPIAIDNLISNCLKNKVTLNIILSDMFKEVKKQNFDYVIINPPFYKRDPVSYKDYAWYCGKNGEFFQKLFGSLVNYIHATSEVIMILSGDCDLELIEAIAKENNFVMKCDFKKKNFMEENFIYRIEKTGIKDLYTQS